MIKKLLLICILAALGCTLLLCACNRTPRPSPPSDSPSPDHSTASVEGMEITVPSGDTYTFENELAVFYREAFASAAYLDADLYGLSAYTIRILYFDKSYDQYTMYPDPAAQTIWVSYGGKTYELGRRDSHEILSHDLYASLYLDVTDETVALTYPYGQMDIPISGYSLYYRCPTGWKLAEKTYKTAVLPVPVVATAGELQFAVDSQYAASESSFSFLDGNDNIVLNPAPGTYTGLFRVSFYDDAGLHFYGTIDYRFTVELRGLPTINLESSTVYQGGLFSVHIQNCIAEDRYTLTDSRTGLAAPLHAMDGYYVTVIDVPADTRSGEYTLTLYRSVASTGEPYAAATYQYTVLTLSSANHVVD